LIDETGCGIHQDLIVFETRGVVLPTLNKQERVPKLRLTMFHQIDT